MPPLNYKRTLGHNVITTEIDPSATWGADTVIWHFTVILAGVRIGDGCSIGSRCEIGRGSIIGNGTRIGSGTFLPPNSVIGENVFIGPNVTFTDDMHPKVHGPDDHPYHAQPPVIEDGAAIGAGAVILPGVRIGKHARVAAGAVVTKDVVEYGMVKSIIAAKPRTAPPEWEVRKPMSA